jgi:hypothetical protein
VGFDAFVCLEMRYVSNDKALDAGITKTRRAFM